MVSPRTWLPAGTAALSLALLAPPAADAEYKTTTAQALAAHAEWLPYAPPPENGAAAVCLVDTGVDLNPDTSSNVVARLALDGGNPGDLSESKHGTQMAMVMGAPINGWGMVGAWPGVRIVSVRVVLDESGRFSFAGYRNALETCLEHAREYGVTSIALPLDGAAPSTPDERAALSDSLRRAADRQVSVLAAAGNSGGEPSALASEPQVVAVGASAPDGALCSFTARGDAVPLFLVGCGLDEADPATGAPSVNGGGTSQATVIAAAFAAAVRSFRPDLAASAVVDLLHSSQDPSVNLVSTFSSAGLKSVVEAAIRMREPLNSRSIGHLRSAPAPRVRVRRISRGAWAIMLINRPTGAIVAFRDRRRGKTVLRRRALRIILRRRPSSLCIEYRFAYRPPTSCVALAH